MFQNTTLPIAFYKDPSQINIAKLEAMYHPVNVRKLVDNIDEHQLKLRHIELHEH